MPKRRFFTGFLRTLISLFVTLAILVGLGLYYLENQVPPVAALKDIQLQVPLRIYTKEGELLGEFGEMRRLPLTLDQIPPTMIAAVLATEDQRFFDHPGIDPMGLMRAAIEVLTTGVKTQGGSTITMQVARNFYLTREKTYMRKVNEILLAIKIDRELSKEKILELYLNKIYLGKRAYGVAAAAQVYYGKTLDQLTLPEIAMIAGLPKAPSALNPIANPEASKTRRDHVLERMRDLGYIDTSAYEQAIATPETAKYHYQPIQVKAPYVAEMVRNLMIAGFGDDAYIKGYHVYTTIDGKLQEAGNLALINGVLAYDQRHGYRGPEAHWGKFTPDHAQEWKHKLSQMPTVGRLKPIAITSISGSEATGLLGNGKIISIPAAQMSWARRSIKVGDVVRVQHLPDNTWKLAQIPKVEAALVAIDPQNGAIRTLVGGFDYDRSNFNRVIQAQRQPGSGFKPFIYAAALSKGFTLASIVNDSPISFWDAGSQSYWSPQNANRKYRGPIRLLVALTFSINVVSVRLLQAMGVSYAIEYISHFGFDPKRLPKNFTLALGTPELTPLEVATGYTVFANGGYKVNPYIIDRVVDGQGKLVYQAKPKIACEECIADGSSPPKEKADLYAPRAISSEIAFLMVEGLKNVVRHGTATRALALNREDISGKTGTTNDQVDAWFNGFNSDIVASAWLGFDQPSSLHEYGAQGALPIWMNFMQVALEGKPEHSMPQPPGIISVSVNLSTGREADPNSESSFEEFFQASNPPSGSNPAELDNDTYTDGNDDSYDENNDNTTDLGESTTPVRRATPRRVELPLPELDDPLF